MAHLMKSTRGATGGLTRHYERFKNEKGEYLKFGNQEINTEKTHLNYNLAAEKNQFEFIKKRTSEVRCLNRKDVNVMCSWVVTLPGKIKSPEDQEKFFKESYNFLEEKYGKENVISSFVHLDEVTPHMHFAFIPVVYDKKKEEYKVSAKECITKNDLKRFHPEFEKYMENIFGRDIGILNEKTKEGNRSIKELKQETAIKELNSLKENIKDKQVDLDNAKNDLNAIRKDLDRYARLNIDLEAINRLEGKEGLLSRGKIVLDKDDFEFLKDIAKKQLVIESKYKSLIKENKNLKSEIDGFKEYRNDNHKEKVLLHKEIRLLKKELESENDKLDIFKEFIKKENLVGNLKIFLDERNKKILEFQKNESREWEMEL